MTDRLNADVPREEARTKVSDADQARIEYRLAHIWEEKGKRARALAGYERALTLEPRYREAHVGLVRALVGESAYDRALECARTALRLFPEEATLHKHFIASLRETGGGLAAAFEAYQLHRVDARPVELAADALLCCAAVRNEVVRLPYWLEFYRRQGVTAFFVVDNGSTDGTEDLLRRQPDVHLWRSPLPFTAANFGSAWFEILLQAYGIGHWTLTVDADELLYFVDCESRTIRDLCRDLDGRGKRAFFAPLLDMYSDQPVADTHAHPGEPFEQACAFFDRQIYHRRFDAAGPYVNVPMIFGGPRERVFGRAGEYLLSKIPLLKYSTDCVLAGGQHWTSYPAVEIAEETGAVLHFKFMDTFPAYVREEAERKVHAQGGHQYLEYARGVEESPGLSLFDPDHSVRFTGSAGLEARGILNRGDKTSRPYAGTLRPIPVFDPVLDDGPRPFWSVMVTVYDRTEFLEQTLTSVMNQSMPPDRLAIEVVQDGGLPEDIRARVRQIVERVGQGRITLHVSGIRLGQPEIFNECIRRARGIWIHLLHDDDWVDPGFYAALEEGSAREPSAGAAMCRWRFAGSEDAEEQPPAPERAQPGIVADWVERIAVVCRVQMPAIVVRRAAYETVGGYWAEAGSAFDWDMWKRLASRYPLWYDPAVLSNFRRHDGQLSHGLMATGQQVADSRRSIELAQAYLPEDRVGVLTDAALEHYAHHAIWLAERQLTMGLPEAALANIREGLACSRRDSVVRALHTMLQRVHARESQS